MSINVTTALAKPLSLVLLSLFTGTALVGDLRGVTMSDRVDRVARAICDASHAGRLFPWDSLDDALREPWREMAAAAINALGQEAV